MYMMEDSRPFHERLYNDPAMERRKKEAERAKERTLRKSKIHELAAAWSGGGGGESTFPTSTHTGTYI
jgi:hypothetical protein